MKNASAKRGALVLLNLTVCAAPLAAVGCDSSTRPASPDASDDGGIVDASTEPPFTCEEPNGCWSPFEQLVAGCLKVDDDLTAGARRWRSKVQTSQAEPFEPSYVFLVREKHVYWNDYFLSPEYTEKTETYRIVVERGVATEKRALSGLAGSPEEFDTVEKLFEFLAEAQCLPTQDPVVTYRTMVELDSTLGYPSFSEYKVDLDESGDIYSWNIDCLALDTSDAAACPLPTE